MTQLVIPLAGETSYQPEDFFISESNRLAYEMVMQWPRWTSYGLWLAGPPRSGKTHLAHLWAQQAMASFVSGSMRQTAPHLLLQSHRHLVIDGQLDTYDETWLFHLLNAVKAEQCSLLITALQPPVGLAWRHPDLSSRLLALPLAQLHQPDDVLLRSVMVKLLTDKQLRVSSDAIDYLLLRVERSCAAVAEWVELLDKSSLQHKRKITLPFIKEIFTKNVL